VAIEKFRRAVHPPLDTAESTVKRWMSDISEALPQFIVYSATINPASVSASVISEEAFTVTGVRTDDHILSVTHGDIVGTGIGVLDVRISAANTIAITFSNDATGSVNIASSTWEFLIMRMKA